MRVSGVMDYANPQALVSTEWLAGNLDAPGVRIVDATFFLPTQDRDAKAEYAAAHIPGAVFFDVDDICDPSPDLPHMLPSAEIFSVKMGTLGFGDGDHVIAYDANGGAMAAARAWWMFRIFGHGKVSLLDGGLPKWLAEGCPVTDEATRPKKQTAGERENKPGSAYRHDKRQDHYCNWSNSPFHTALSVQDTCPFRHSDTKSVSIDSM